MIKVNDEVIRNLHRPEVREAPKKRRWEWTRCRPLLIVMAVVVFWVYLKWAGFVRW